MGTQVSDGATIAAPLETVHAVITDVGAYPEWTEGVLETEVVATNEDGSPHHARFRVDARVAEITYVIEYRYEGDDVAWHLVEGETVSQLDGRYELSEQDGGTAVRYTLEVDVDLPVPSFLKKRAARTILEQGLSGLQRRAESRA